MSQRDDAVVKQLVALLATKGEAPRSAVDCEELVQFVVDEYPQFERRAVLIAWLLIVEAARTPDAVGGPKRPLAAAKHLLALGSYPEDIEREAGSTLLEIRHSRPESGDLDPVRWVTVRRKIATRAGNYGTDPSNLNPSHPGRKLKRVAEALWSQIKELAKDPDLVSGLTADWDQSHGPELASQSTSSRDIALRRLRRMSRRRWTSRAINSIPEIAGKTMVALLVVGLFAGGVVFLKTVVGDQATNVDPRSAIATGEPWVPGVGPLQATRSLSNDVGLEVNPTRESWMFGTVVTGSFLEVEGEFGDYQGYASVVPGRYKVTVPIRLVQDDVRAKTGGRTTEASIQLGILPNSSHTDNLAVYALIEADGVAPIWDGEGLLMACDCTIELDPSSVRLFSDALPQGLRLGGGAIDSPALIGYAGADGVLHSGFRDQVRVVAEIVVAERNWEG